MGRSSFDRAASGRDERRARHRLRPAGVRCREAAAAILLALIVATSANAAILYVDNSRPPGGAGTADRPFATLAEAQAWSRGGEVIYVAEGNAPYEGGITLKLGQQLIGAAFGIAGTIPAVRGPGPRIHGSVAMLGDNVVAGCTIVAEKNAAINAIAPAGPIAVRDTFVRVSREAFGLFLQNCGNAKFEGGGLDATGGATGVVIDGGGGAITFDHFAIRGAFASAIAVRNRASGSVVMRGPLTVDDATGDAIAVQNDRGSVVFEGPVRVTTHGGRGLFVTKSDAVSFSGRIDATDATALEVHDSKLVATFDSISAGGRLAEGIILEKARGGKIVIGGGAIEHASRTGIRIEQSDHVQLSSMRVVDSGSENAVYLRHLRHAKLSGIEIRGGGGLAASNIEDVGFDSLTIADATKAALFIEEAIGAIPFTRCTIADPAGAALVVEQRFNAGRVTFDRGEISAANRPAAAPYLIDARTFGGGRLDLGFDTLRLHDSAGSAIALAASNASTLSLAVLQSYGQGLGGAFVDATAHHAAHVAVVVHDTHVDFPASRGKPLVSIDSGSGENGAAESCLDFASNALIFGGDAPPLRVRAGVHSRVLLAGTAPAGSKIESEAPVVSVPACR